MSNDTYSYPLDDAWTTEEMITVMDFYQAIEWVYEKNMDAQLFMERYRAFKKVVPSIAEEKSLGKQFEMNSGYSLYHAVQNAKANPTNKKLYIRGKN